MVTKVLIVDDSAYTRQMIKKIVMMGDLRAGVFELLQGQRTGRVSMWLVENYPEQYPYRHLHTLRYFFCFPVPRAWWPAKPSKDSSQTAPAPGK